MRLIDLTGRRFVRLEVTGRAPDRVTPGGHHRVMWHCICDCGARQVVDGGHLRVGATLSCGCLSRERTGNRNLTHGLTSNPLYGCWYSMVARCTKPAARGYLRYGGRGISVCARWMDYPTFLGDIQATIGPRPDSPEGWASRSPYWTLDRINGDGDYEPGNVRWATPSQQTQNRRTATECAKGHAYTAENTYITPQGKRQCRACWRAGYERRKAERIASEPPTLAVHDEQP